ncbi:MAG: ImmA/IrrE family metallo-endopeptidase [Desulfobacteraceae bacterium]|nr:ImmA/IrrE family metallo-endopeptidase [Desulfobacteraceae bacterium]
MDNKHRQELVRSAALKAERVRLSAEIPQSAPVDPVDVAIKCGCEVVFMRLPSLEGMYSTVPRPAIVIGSERPAGRRAYTCAHELAHHIFKHETKFDDLNTLKDNSGKVDEEFVADAFAGFLLMSQTAIIRALKDRGWSANTLQPEQVFRLANFFGVGYSSMINHLALSLQILPRTKAAELQRVMPGKIKAKYGSSGKSEVVILDYNWSFRAVDLEIGDTLVLPQGAGTEPGNRLELISNEGDHLIYRAINSGLARAFCAGGDWAANVRISRKNYKGLAQYRFLEDSEIEI